MIKNIKKQSQESSSGEDSLLKTSNFFYKLKEIDLTKTPFNVFNVDLDFEEFFERLDESNIFNVISFKGDKMFNVCDDPNASKIDYGKSSGFFCLHTDGQEFSDVPVMAILHCLSEGRSDIPTDFIDSVDLIKLIKRKGLLEKIEKYDFAFIDRNGKETRRQIIEKHPLTNASIMNISLGSDQCTFVPKKEYIGMATEGDSLYRNISNLADKELIHTPHYYKNKQVVVFDNARFIHGRGLSNLKDINLSDRNRHLVRMWLNYKE